MTDLEAKAGSGMAFTRGEADRVVACADLVSVGVLGAMARKATAEAQVRQARNGLDAAIDNGRLEITSAYTEWEAAQELVDAQRKALDLARESLSIAQVSYENGLITSIELSDARQSLIETEWNLAQAKFAQILAAARTRFAAGLT